MAIEKGLTSTAIAPKRILEAEARCESIRIKRQIDAIGKTMLSMAPLSPFDLSKRSVINLHNEAHVYIDGKDEGVSSALDYRLSKDDAELIEIDPTTEATYSSIYKKQGIKPMRSVMTKRARSQASSITATSIGTIFSRNSRDIY